MTGRKSVAAVVLAVVLSVAQISVAAAAPVSQGTTATVISCTADGSGGWNIDYTTDGGATTSTVNLSDADAQTLGIVDGTGACNTGGTFDTGGLPADPCDLPDDASQPVGGALTSFFCGSQGTSYDMIEGWHIDGFGYGVIAQALFAADMLGLDPQAVLDAKKSGDYSALGLEGVNNWGQLRKAVLNSGEKSLSNLGAIMSGRADPAAPSTTLAGTTGKSKSGNHGHGFGKSGDHGNPH
jgi:hypothetical protein